MGSIIFQVLSAFILYCSCFNLGLIFSWPSSTLMLYKSEETPLHRPMVGSELALLGSLFSAGALVGNPIVGTCLDRLGRKYCAIFTAGVGAISWALIAASTRVEVILIGGFLSGISAAVFLVVPIYVNEFSNESIRGALISGAVVSKGLGLLVSYLIGGLLSYKVIVYIYLTLSVFGVILLTLLKESPTLLMKKGMEEEAKRSIEFYKNAQPDSKLVMEEVLKIKRSLAPEGQELRTPEEKKLTSEMQEKVPAKILNFFQFMKKSKSTQRALLVSITLMTAAIFQGMIVVLVYAQPLFSEAIPEEIMSATWCSVVLAAVLVVAGSTAAYLTDLAGRRSLMIFSSLAAGICCVGMGTQIHLHWGPEWLTAVFIYLFSAFYMHGAGTVPYVLLAELFLPEVRSVVSMIVLEWTWLCNFTVLFIFTPLVDAIGLGPIFYMFAAFCIATAVFCVFFLPETKGLPVDAIQLLFVKQKRSDVI